jgi:hypothetical protein
MLIDRGMRPEFFEDAVPDLTAVNAHLVGGHDPHGDVVPVNLENGNDEITLWNDRFFPKLSCQYEHTISFLMVVAGVDALFPVPARVRNADPTSSEGAGSRNASF